MLSSVDKFLVGSSATHVVQIKDRHNGNILLDSEGHIIHIDFGFLLTNSPGGNAGFESAPFKLTAEFADVMGGPRSSLFRAYRNLCVRAFLEARKRRDKIIVLVEMMLSGNEGLPCFVRGAPSVMSGLTERFVPRASSRQAVVFAHSLIDRCATVKTRDRCLVAGCGGHRGLL